MVYIVGLGNPLPTYEDTRHNVGQALCTVAIEAWHLDRWHDDSYRRTLISEGMLGEIPVVFILPQTYMNESGGVFRTIPPDELKDVIVVHDDIDLPIGTFRIVHDRGTGGHNGLESIVTALGTEDFTRVKIGISPRDTEGEMRKPNADEVGAFVLRTFTKHEKELLAELFPRVLLALETIVRDGYEHAMNQYN